MIQGRLLSVCLVLTIAFTSQAQDRVHCVGALPATMTVGDMGYVTDAGANNVRDGASIDATIIGTLEVGAHFTVISAPVCVDGYIWYEVETGTISGWTAESGDGEYWLLPVLEPVRLNWDNIQQVRTLNCPFLHSFSFSQAGDALLIACGGEKSRLLIYEMATDTVITDVALPFADNLQTAHYVAADSLILVRYDRGTFAVLDAATFESLNAISFSELIQFTYLSLDRTLLFHSEPDSGTTLVFDTSTLEQVTVFPYPSGSVVTDPYNALILLGSTLLTVDSELNIMNQQDIPGGFSAIAPNLDIAIAPLCTYADHGCQSAEIRWIDLDTLDIIRVFRSMELTDSGGVTFLRDGSAFLLNECGALVLSNTQTYSSMLIDAIDVACGNAFAISPDGHYLATPYGPAGDEFNRDYLQIYRIGDI